MRHQQIAFGCLGDSAQGGQQIDFVAVRDWGWGVGEIGCEGGSLSGSQTPTTVGAGLRLAVRGWRFAVRGSRLGVGGGL